MRPGAVFLVVATAAFAALDVVVCQSIPVVSLHPVGSVHPEGDTLSLTCRTNSTVDLVEWFRDGVFVGSGTEYRIDQFTDAQAGSYTCRLTSHDVGTVTSAFALLQLAVFEASPPGEQPDTPFSVSAPVNQPFTLSCGSLVSTPPTTYDWRFQGFEILDGDNAIIGVNDGLLYLQLVTESLADLSTFVCTAHNPLTDEARTGYIRLETTGSSSSAASPRVMMAPPQDTVASVGDTVFFQCIVGGSPVPAATEIDWAHPASTAARFSQSNTILTVRSVAVGDAGVYTCNVTGLGIFSATLTVLIPPVLSASLPPPPLAPIFRDPLSLSCSVGNTLVTEWIWYHNGERISHATTGTLDIGAVDSTLHDGVYQCFAYNEAGNDSSATSVHVRIIQANLTDISLLTPQLLFEGSLVSYRCAAKGAPLPHINWYIGETQVDIGVSTMDAEARETASEVVLESVRVRDSGDYTCRAANVVGGVEVGHDEATAILRVITMTVITRPSESQPIYTPELSFSACIPCQAEAQEGTVLHFSWEKDGAPLLYDGVRVSLSNNSNSVNISFTSVEEGDTGFYQCKVVTEFEGLQTPPVSSIIINVTAIPEMQIPPELDPVNPFSKVTSTSFQINWYFSGFNAQTKLTGYTITFREKGSDDIIAEFMQPVTEPNSIVISLSETTLVKPYTTYVVTVWANYKSGESVGVEIEVTTAEDVPSAPRDVTGTLLNSTAILVHWTPPEMPNGIITNYTLRYKHDSSGSLYVSLPLSSNTTAYHLAPLLQRTSYLVEVAASTSVGQGPFSEVIVVSTHHSESTPFYKKAWFIGTMCAVGPVAIIAAIVALGGGISILARKHKKKYTVHSSVEMEKVRNGGGSSTRSLTEDDMMDYNGRGSRMENGLLFDGRESESSLGDKYTYSYEPSLSTTASGSQAPAYINPPPFEEAVKRGLTSSRLPSTAYSDPPSATYTTATDSEWGLDSSSKTRMLQLEEPSPSPARSYQPSPLHSSSPPPPPLPTSQRPAPGPPPPPPPLFPHSPTHSEHKYASLKDIDYTTGYREEEEEGELRYTTNTVMANPMYDDNGYNCLPSRNNSISDSRRQQQQQAPSRYVRSHSTTPQYTISTSSYPVGAPLKGRSNSQNIRTVHCTTPTTPPPPHSTSSQMNVLRGSMQHVHAVNSTRLLPQLAKTASQPNFATFV